MAVKVWSARCVGRMPRRAIAHRVDAMKRDPVSLDSLGVRTGSGATDRLPDGIDVQQIPQVTTREDTIEHQ